MPTENFKVECSWNRKLLTLLAGKWSQYYLYWQPEYWWHFTNLHRFNLQICSRLIEGYQLSKKATLNLSWSDNKNISLVVVTVTPISALESVNLFFNTALLPAHSWEQSKQLIRLLDLHSASSIKGQRCAQKKAVSAAQPLNQTQGSKCLTGVQLRGLTICMNRMYGAQRMWHWQVL